MTEDNKGRGGDDMEAEAGKRAAENEGKKAKKTCQRKKGKPQRKLRQTAVVAGCCEG